MPGSKSTSTARGTYLPPAKTGRGGERGAGRRPGGGRGGRTCGLVVVHVDALQLQVAVSVVRARRVDAMFVADHLPKLPEKTPSAPACSAPRRPAGRSPAPALPPAPPRRPHLGPDLVAALPGLQVHDLPHDGFTAATAPPMPLFPPTDGVSGPPDLI